jgi:uncharacterized membrane protein
MKRALIALALTLVLANQAVAASFRGLGDLAGGPFESVAYRVSPDGSAACGIASGPNSTDDDFEAFRWTAGAGMVSLGFLESDDIGAAARDVTPGGAVVIGESDGVAFRWTPAGMDGAGLPGGADAWAISDDGATIAGSMTTFAGTRAMRWTAAGGAQPLPALPGNLSAHTAVGISADGSVIAGTQSDPGRAFYWTESTGSVGLPIPAGAVQAQAMGLSGDGSTIVGRLYYMDHNEAFAWKITGEALRIPGFGGSNAEADGASADGSVIVGYSEALGAGSSAFIWDSAHGTRNLQDVLVGLGVDLTGWRLAQAMDVSADGRTIVGYGQNPQGFTEAWIATVPEPSMLILAALGGLTAVVWDSRRRLRRRPA